MMTAAPAMSQDRPVPAGTTPATRASSDCAPDSGTPPAVIPNCLRLIPTRHAAGARGVVRLVLAPSPFAVTVTPEGRYIYRIEARLAGLRHGPATEYAVWATTPDLSERRRLGTVDREGAVTGTVDWNKFMIVVTAEHEAPADAPGGGATEGWRGPVLLTATSPSGRLATMAGEEIFGNNELPVRSRYCLMHEC